MDVATLVEGLAGVFPLGEGEPWDRSGLLVGDPAADVTGVLCALDPTRAREAGANVLLTHHPAFLDPPCPIGPDANRAGLEGRVLWEAVRSGVALVGFHTCLDRSIRAREHFARLLGLELCGPATEEGYGALLACGAMTVGDLAARVAERLGTRPTLWGDEGMPVARAAYLSGSLGSMGPEAVSAGAQVVICGEAGYHRLTDLAARGVPGDGGVATILVGHDASERPLADLLAEVVRERWPDVRVEVWRQPLPWHIWAGAESTS